jgi:hypothetical protein
MEVAQSVTLDPGLAGASGFDAAAVLGLRRAIYGKDGVTRADVAGLLVFGRAAGQNAGPEYADLLSEAATDFLVRQVDPPGYIPAVEADWLIAQLADGGGLACRAEFAMLVDLLGHAVSTPPALTAFAVREVEKAILTGRRAATGEVDHAPGVVTAGDVAALRSLVFATTQGSSLHVTEESAEALFDIAHATAGAANDPAFDDFFAKAVGNYLIGVEFRWTPAASVVLEHEHWADRPSTLMSFLGGMVSATLGERLADVRTENASVDDLDERSFAQENAADAAAMADAAAIKRPAADWVIAHLTREGALSSAEKRLLAFIAAEAASTPESLSAAIKRLSAPEPVEESAP